MKKWNCPDCEATADDSCEHCYRQKLTQTTTTYTDYGLELIENGADLCVSEACRHCGNHPSNGGSGVCFCVLGSINVY